MVREFATLELFCTNRALDLDLGTVSLNMLPELGPRQVLELRQVANVASEFRTLIHLHVLL